MREITVELPDDVYDYCTEVVAKTEFGSVQEYIEYVQTQVMRYDTSESGDEKRTDERDIEKHLESLGYR